MQHVAIDEPRWQLERAIPIDASRQFSQLREDSLIDLVFKQTNGFLVRALKSSGDP